MRAYTKLTRGHVQCEETDTHRLRIECTLLLEQATEDHMSADESLHHVGGAPDVDELTASDDDFEVQRRRTTATACA
jgi:hypothetical protein